MNSNVQRQWSYLSQRMKETTSNKERAILRTQQERLKPALQAEYAKVTAVEHGDKPAVHMPVLNRSLAVAKPESKPAQPSPKTVHNLPFAAARNLAFDQWRVLTSQAGLHLLDRVAKIVLAHESKTRQRQERELDAANYRKLIHAVTANLVYQDLIHRGTALPQRMGIHISRDKNALRSKESFRYNASFMSERLTRLLDTMAATDLIVQEVPFGKSSVRTMTKNGRVLCNETVIYPSGQFTALIHTCGVSDLYADVWRFESGEDREEIVVLKSLAVDGEDDVANRLHYEDTPTTQEYRKWTRKFNEHLASVSMEVVEPLKPSRTTGLRLDLRNRLMKRIFNRGRLTSLGRYYGSTWWLPVSKQERLERGRLNGEKIGELDFSSMLVRLAYGLVGLQPPEGDQYTIPGFERSRDAMKILFCARLFQRPGRTKRNNLPKDALPLFHPEELRDTATVLAAMDAKHPALVPLFATTVGHDLFFKESQLLSEVMAQMLKHSIPFLPVHDALYLPVSQVEKGKRIMEGLFLGMVGINGLVRVSDGENRTA